MNVERSRYLVNINPARRIIVGADNAKTLGFVLTSLVGKNFNPYHTVNDRTIIFQYGNLLTGFLGSFGFGLFPGRVGKNGYAVVETEPHPEGTLLTIAHTLGTYVGAPLIEAIDETLNNLRNNNLLVDDGDLVFAQDLPISMLSNPITFRTKSGVSFFRQMMTA